MISPHESARAYWRPAFTTQASGAASPSSAPSPDLETLERLLRSCRLRKYEMDALSEAIAWMRVRMR